MSDVRALFVERDWLRAHLSDPALRIVDTRSTPHGAPGIVQKSGRERYAEGHLPGAVHIDYAEDIHDLATPYAARVAPADRFAEVMEASGIGDETLVVAYDDGDVPYAPRMLWMLHYYGHDNARILAGGLGEWIAAGFPVTTDAPAPRRATFTPRERRSVRASREDVLAVVEGRSDAQLVETQRDASYALRDRDLPRAVRLSGSQLLEDARGGRIAEDARLDELIGQAGLDRGKRTIVSCGSGVSASGSWLALRAAGFTDVAVYDGSWMEWKHDGLPTIPK